MVKGSRATPLQQVTSRANNTKWRELREHMMVDWTRTPAWRAKYLPWLTRDTWELQQNAPDYLPLVFFGEARWDVDWYYHLRSDNTFREMESVDIKPRDTADAMSIDEVMSACTEIGLDWKLFEGFVRVFGYRRSRAKDE